MQGFAIGPTMNARTSSVSFLLLCSVAGVAMVIGCGPVPVSDGLSRYRAAVEVTLGTESIAADSPLLSATRLPRRRSRRLEVTDQTLGPFDFLAVIGCPLSERIGARNGSLGRVLEPSRRLAHEIAILSLADSCLSSLDPERAARIASLFAAKRAELGAHVWNAVWLDEELERFLSGGPRSLLGGADSNDAPWQLARLGSVIAGRPLEAIDVAALETALSELRDDPAAGPLLGELDRARFELDRVAALLHSVPIASCDRTSRRLAREFRERYLPLQRKLAALDRRGRDLLEALDSLYRVTSVSVEPPKAMRAFAASVLDVETSRGLWSRYRTAARAHAQAWAPILEACALLPQVDV